MQISHLHMHLVANDHTPHCSAPQLTKHRDAAEDFTSGNFQPQLKSEIREVPCAAGMPKTASAVQLDRRTTKKQAEEDGGRCESSYQHQQQFDLIVVGLLGAIQGCSQQHRTPSMSKLSDT